MDFKIRGGNTLRGEVTTNFSKNGAMGLLAASLLNEKPTTLHGIPRIEEVQRVLEIFESIGVKSSFTGENSVKITPPTTFDIGGIDDNAARRIRSSIMMIGPLLHQSSSFSLPYAGGCKMGRRTIAAHKHGLEQLGASIQTEEERYKIKAKDLTHADVVMYEKSDTATENVLMAAAGIPGKTTIHFAGQNYMVQDVTFFLLALGLTIEGVGHNTITVHGSDTIAREVEHWNSEDPIESMLWISAALLTDSKLTIKRCPIDFLRLELLTLQLMGAELDISDEYLSYNGRTKLVDVVVKPSQLRAPEEKIHALPYPGINTDNLPYFVPIATKARGITLIHDWMWENRAIYFSELNRLGADIRLADPHRVFVHGPTDLKPAQVVCPPALRPAAIVMISMLAAPGDSVLRTVYSIQRGYENIAERLSALGANIEILERDE